MLKLAQAKTDRREFLVRSAATAAGTFMSIGLPALSSSAVKAEGMSSFTPSIWFTLTPDGKVTMHIVKCEMGQHIGTGLAIVVGFFGMGDAAANYQGDIDTAGNFFNHAFRNRSFGAAAGIHIDNFHAQHLAGHGGTHGYFVFI